MKNSKKKKKVLKFSTLYIGEFKHIKLLYTISVIECLTSDAIVCEIYNMHRILFQPMKDCFLGFEFIEGMGSASLKEKPCLFLFFKMHHCEARKYWQLYTGNNKECRIIVE